MAPLVLKGVVVCVLGGLVVMIVLFLGFGRQAGGVFLFDIGWQTGSAILVYGGWAGCVFLFGEVLSN